MVVFIGVLSLSSSVEARKKKPYDCSAKIARAFRQFEKKRYGDVKTILDEVKMNCSGHASLDTALYYLGKSYLMTKQPVQASLEFEVLVQDYPNSAFNEEGHFLLGICRFKQSPSYEKDQAKTRDAIRELEEFVEVFPQSRFTDSANVLLRECREKLVKKEFVNARFYDKIDQFEAANVYYKLIVSEYPQSSYVTECKLSVARNLVRLSRGKEAKDVLDAILSSDVDDETRKKALMIKERIEKPETRKRRWFRNRDAQEKNIKTGTFLWRQNQNPA